MHLDEVGRELVRGSDMSQFRFDEQAHRDSSIVKHPYDLLKAVFVGVDIESAFRGEFLSLFGDERNQIRFDRQRNLRHGLIRRHFQVEFCTDHFPEQVKITVLDVTAVLSQMDDDAVRSGQLHQHRRRERIGIGSAARLAQGGDMIDIHTESGHKETSG